MPIPVNLFRATQTEEKLRRENVRRKDTANRIHQEVGRKVRMTIQNWVAQCRRSCQWLRVSRKWKPERRSDTKQNNGILWEICRVLRGRDILSPFSSA